MSTPTTRSRAAANLRPARRVVALPPSQLSVISIHHTASSTTWPWRDVQWAAMSRGLDDAHYNWGVEDPGGVLQELRGDDVRPQADGVNSGTCAIVVRGNYQTRLPGAAALETLAWKIAERARAAGRLTIRAGNPPAGGPAAGVLYIVHHRERMSTACPGQRLHNHRPTLIARVRALLEEDEMSWTDPIRHRPWLKERWPVYGDEGTPEAIVSAGLGFSRLAADRTAELLAGQAALLAAVAGEGVVEAVREELNRHYAELLAELSQDLVDALRDEFAELPAERVEQAMLAAMAKVRLAVDDDEDQGDV